MRMVVIVLTTKLIKAKLRDVKCVKKVTLTMKFVATRKNVEYVIQTLMKEQSKMMNQM